MAVIASDLSASFLYSSQKTDSCISSCLRRATQAIHWMIENRGGLAAVIGLIVVPAQYMCPQAKESQAIIDHAVRNDINLEKFDLLDHSLKGVIYYPSNWSRLDQSRCVVFHNPNGATIANYFETGFFDYTPAKIAEWAQCPVIMYDYRGTGLSSGMSNSPFRFRPTCASIVDDGEAVHRFALEKFNQITILGTSLGGGVATASLAQHINREIPAASLHCATGRVRLINHDSFSSITSVIAPRWPKLAKWAGWAVGGYLDAATPMKKLIEQGLPVAVLCHKNDPIIPSGARMAEYIAALPHAENVSTFISPNYGHGNLSQDMVAELHRIDK
jgi:pimeloyl-ACP methyl ester carboxylesterase